MTQTTDGNMLYARQEPPVPAGGAQCKCAIGSPDPAVIPPACPVHGVPCETCGQVEGCAPECETATEVESALARAGETAGIPGRQSGYGVLARTGAVLVTYLQADTGERLLRRAALARWAAVLCKAGWDVFEWKGPDPHLRVLAAEAGEEASDDS